MNIKERLTDAIDQRAKELNIEYFQAVKTDSLSMLLYLAFKRIVALEVKLSGEQQSHKSQFSP